MKMTPSCCPRRPHRRLAPQRAVRYGCRMKTVAKIALGLFVFIGPPVLYEWGVIGGDPVVGMYLAGLVIGGILGAWYQRSQQDGEWSEFRRNYSFKRRKNIDLPLG
jgi:hypothetical protein